MVSGSDPLILMKQSHPVRIGDRSGRPLCDSGVLPTMRRRDALLGLLAAQLRYLSGICGATFLSSGRGWALDTRQRTESCDPSAEGDRSLKATRRRRRIARGLEDGFGVQYWGATFNANELAAAPHGLLIVEMARLGADATHGTRETFFSADETDKIKKMGQRPVLAYLNLAKVEPYRNYWVDAAIAHAGRKLLQQGDEPWVGPSLGADGTLARFWTPEWAAIVEDRVDRLVQSGVDGLFLDDVLQYYTYHVGVSESRPGFVWVGDPNSVSDFARAMMQLVITVAKRARQNGCEMLIVVNNGVFIGRDAGSIAHDTSSESDFAHYLSEIDGILIESVFAHGGDKIAIAALHEDFADHGVPVLAIDFLDASDQAGGSTGQTRAEIAGLASREGFAAYVVDDPKFNRLYPPIPLREGPMRLP